jgi:maltose O-acetyltransferase
MGFKIGNGTSIFMHCTFNCSRNFEIGYNSVINTNCKLDNRGNIYIGNNVSISTDSIILTSDHDISTSNLEGRKRKVIIEDFVWIGTRAMILPGVVIHKGGIIGASSVITKDVQSYNVVSGIPGKFIKKRREDLIYSSSYKRLFQ